MKTFAIAVAVGVHAALLMGAGFVHVTLPAERDVRWGDGRLDVALVARPAVDSAEPVALPPPLVDRDAIPQTRREFIELPPDSGAAEGDETDTTLPEGGEPPPAPSIAVDGGAHASLRPRFATFARPGAWKGGRLGRGRKGATGDGDGDGVAAAPVVGPPAPEPVVEAVIQETPREAVFLAARLVEHAQPRYPEAARARRVMGVVRLECDVLADGSVGDVRIVESSGSALLDDAAVSAVRRWTFAPATLDGVAVACAVVLPAIRFHLR